MTNLYPFGSAAASAESETSASVATRHPDYLASEPIWSRVDAALNGNDGVKAAAPQFLPMTEYDKRNPDQYWAYVQRANFVNYSLRTVAAMEGMIYRKDPNIRVPKQYEPRLENIDNQGNSFIVFSKKVVTALIRHGRVGILGDYAGDDADPADSLLTYPFLTMYDARSIINWRVRNVRGRLALDQVVLMEHYEQFLEFGSRQRVRFRVLDLEGGRYRARIYERRDNGEFGLSEVIYPGKPRSDGKYMDKIPFVFINPVDTSVDVHRPPILDLIDLNLSHFKTSADYKNASHILSQPTAVITGLPEDSPVTLQLNAPAVLKLPEGATASYLEMTADGIAATERALAGEEQQMREIGAQMLSSSSDGPETAAAARIRQHGSTSVLSSLAGSASTGFQSILQTVCDWDRLEGDKVNVELNQDYIDATADQPILAELNRMRDSGSISDQTYFWNLKRMELVPPELTFEEYKAELDKQEPRLRIGSPNPFMPVLPAQKAAQKPLPGGVVSRDKAGKVAAQAAPQVTE